MSSVAYNKQVYTKPPPLNARIDWTNPIVRGGRLIAAYRFAGPIVYDAVRGVLPTISGALTGGVGYSTFDGTNDEFEIGNLQDLGMVQDNGSFFARIRPGDTSSSRDSRFFCHTSDVSTTVAGALAISAGVTSHNILVWDGAGWTSVITYSTSWQDEWHDVGITYNTVSGADPDYIAGYFDGELSTKINKTDKIDVDFVWGFGSQYSSGDFGSRFEGDCQIVLLFAGNLPEIAHASLSRNPWQIFQPQPEWLPTDFAGAPAGGIIPQAMHHYSKNTGSGL